MTSNDSLWQSKVAAWVHDPAEKALVLLRDPAGHEGGTVARLKKTLFPQGLPDGMKARIKQADRWAAAADRPQFPMDAHGGRYQEWTQVRFTKEPQLIHPLSGERLDIQGGLDELDPAHLKAVSADHFEQLIVRRPDGKTDWRATALALWRFGPERPARELNILWSLLPADTRVPDHTIWAHLDLASAFAGAFAADRNGTPALLAMSFGPVQDFISQARSTSDLWAGSHLLSRLAWEGLKTICIELGPDAVVFPQLRGVPLVDLWLQEEMKLDAEWFAQCEWRRRETDANPLFAAALPNRFVAIVPADRVRELAETVTARVREWVQSEARETVKKLLAAAVVNEDVAPAYAQAEQQLAGFPEVYWAAVPWSLIENDTDGKVTGTDELAQAMRPFFPEQSQDKPGFLDSPAWKVLSQEIKVDGADFFRPNPGVLYPALADLLDRVAAAAKTARTFEQLPQEGYRCTLCGEREWLTNNRDHLALPPGKRQDAGSLWTRVAKDKRSWARKGEHLCGLCAVKRLWPGRFVDSVRRAVDLDVDRYVVSTHTMALTTSLKAWLQRKKALPDWLRGNLAGVHDQAALPRGLAGNLHGADEDANILCRRLPVWLDDLRAKSAESGQDEQFRQIESRLKDDVFGHKPEAYYGLIMMDGDWMGAWLNGSKDEYRLPFASAWHSRVKARAAEIAGNNGPLRAYLDTLRPVSPARHMAISGALNGFALELTRYVVEDLCTGKLLYAGGDDVLAMVPVDDLLSTLLLLRLVYGGILPDNNPAAIKNLLSKEKTALVVRRGHVLYKGRLFRMMGERATASAGAVVAHHTAPLSMVLRVLRQTEKRAKQQGGRDAFAVTLLKRAGGAVELTCPWLFDPQRQDKAESLTASPMGLLLRLRDAFASPDLSRRAAYLIQDWAAKLPDVTLLPDTASYQEMLAVNLAYQFARQSKGKENKEPHAALGRELAALALAVMARSGRDNPADFITDMLATAEFLAREGRSGDQKGKEATP